MFEESGGNDKKRKWIMIGVGTAIIAIFLLIRNSMNARVQQAAADQTAAAVAPAPTITDQGSYPDMMTGGISGTGMDQTMATYLAIADQNTSVQMGAVSDALTAIHDQMNTNNTALQAQITAMNTNNQVNQIANTTQPPVTSTPATTSHPEPTSFSYVIKKGDTLSQIAAKQYGKQAAYAGGINKIASLNNIANPNRIKAGQTISIPTKI